MLRAFAALLLLTTTVLADYRVIDGDTVAIDGVSVRLQAIDTPETHRSRCDNERALGLAAKARLIALLDGKTVTYTANGTDRYGRTLGNVYANGVDAGKQLLDEGLALPWRPGPQAKAARLAAWCHAG